MKILKYIWGFCLVFLVTVMWTGIHPSLKQKKNYQLYEGNSNSTFMNSITIQENIENHCNFSSTKVMSAEEIKALLGGCGDGGECRDYNSDCDTGCRTFSASKCSGSVGDCSNDYWVVICRCVSGYVFISGC